MAYYDSYDVRFSDDGKVLERCPVSFEGSYIVPFGVEVIESGAFKDCSRLTGLYLPASIKTLKAESFSGVKSLSTLEYAGTLDDWFDVTILCFINSSHKFIVGGEQVTDVVIPKTRTVIPKRAFYYVHGITSVEFHDEIIEIDDHAFNKSSIPGRIVLPPKLKRIGEMAFLSCKEAKGFTIPSSVEFIGEGAFRYCSKVSRFQVIDNPRYCHDGMDLVTADHKTLLAIHQSSLSGKYKVTSNIEIIPDYVFSSMSEKITEIELPFGIKRIGRKAFEGYNGKVIIQDIKADVLDRIDFPRDRVIYSHDYELDFKATNLLQLVSQNPYRILGLGSGASVSAIKESYDALISSSGEKTISFTTDSIPGLDSPVRDPSTIRQAFALLQSGIDRFVWSLFWLKNETANQKKMVDYLCKGGSNSEDLMDFYERDIPFDPFIPIQYLLCGYYSLCIDEYIGIVTNSEYKEFFNTYKHLCDSEGHLLKKEETDSKILQMLSNAVGKDLLKRFIQDRYSKYTASDLIDIINGLKEEEPPLDIVQLLNSAKSAEDSYEAQKEAGYKIFDAIHNKTKEMPPKFLYECGVQIVSNLEKAILISTDRKVRLEHVYDIACCYEYIAPVDKEASVLRSALSRVEKPLDIIPPYDFIEQDCLIYEAMISWLLCNNMQSFLSSFMPIIAPLNEIYCEAFSKEETQGGFRIITKKRYVQEECQLIAEMATNNILRIISDRVKKVGRWFKGKDIDELLVAFSLLTNLKRNLIISKNTVATIIDPALTVISKLINENGLKPSYQEFFTLESEDKYWEKALKDSAGLLKYLLVYGETGKHAIVAKELMAKYDQEDEAMWKKCKIQADYEAYINNSPTCSHKKEAEEIISRKRTNNGFFTMFNVVLIASAIILFILIIK